MIKNYLLPILLFTALFFLTASVVAGVYKWVDEDGHVQFGDRPPPEVEDSDEVKIRSKAPASAPAAKVDRKQARDRLLQQYKQEREEKKAAVVKKRKEKKEQEKRCSYAKDALSEYLEHPVLYERGADQERKYLTDQQRDAEIAKARKAVKRWCK